jgi:hypothetical protein
MRIYNGISADNVIATGIIIGIIIGIGTVTAINIDVGIRISFRTGTAIGTSRLLARSNKPKV